MSYSLFLDDERMPSYVSWIELPLVEWTIVRNYNDFVKTVTERGIPLRISFDHDLSLCCKETSIEEKTGLDCVNFMIDMCIKNNISFPEYYVHSMNIIGRENIRSKIESYKKTRNISV